ncbi:DUF2207 domain-containing protein [Chthonobacter albigriseus]|uniref:DUF2207 domain-containing protein n=1 Tax=Chthonobacter albigriseus TaxID=1683161 RepID=UPI0015EECE66|nr:DUF2207 domain-containing protein [Chthonobacter albigriseus]
MIRAIAALCRTLPALLMVLAAFAALPAHAEERIRSFTVRIEMTDRDLIRVTEQIEVQAEGYDIKRGIYRDIPLSSRTDDGDRREATFKLVSVERNGADEPYRQERNTRGVRIIIGQEDVFLTFGRHTYTIVYETGRQIRRFADHDELFWNVTGNEWKFSIDTARATVILPEGARATDLNAFTGAFGENGRDWTSSRAADGRLVSFVTTRVLRAGEGFTIAVALPTGVIAEPSGSEAMLFAVLDRKDELIGSAGLLLVSLFYLWAWSKVGRDPPGGTVIPLFRAPEGVSPSLAHYIHERGLAAGGWPALSAAAVDLAVKGLIRFEDLDGETRLERTDAPAPPPKTLPAGEAAVLSFLDRRRSLTLSKADGKQVLALGSAFRGAVVGENRGKYFELNRGYVVFGVVLSVATLIAMVAFGRFREEELAFILPLVFGGVWASFAVLKFLSIIRSGASLVRRLLTGTVLVAIAFIGIAVVGGAAVGFLVETLNVWIASIVGGLILANVLFFILLAAPTVAGRKVMDDIEGLRLYLSVAEEERMNMAGAPRMSPSHYETLLPYAIALGVEKPWSKAFQAWLTTAAAAGMAADYEPGWYHGAHFGRDSFASRMSSTVSSLSSSFSSSLPETKSSSSGFSSSGGGGSGGGGGGGGGGGW